jgi:transposase
MIVPITNEVIDMSMSTKLITDSLYQKALEALTSMNEISRIAIRLRAIVSAKEHGVGTVAKVFNITSNTLRNWVKSFENGNDAKALAYTKGRGRKNKLLEVHRSAIEKWIELDCNLTINQILIRLHEQFGLQTSKSAVHRVLVKLNLSYMTPRPRHYKQDPSKKLGFKKKSI